MLSSSSSWFVFPVLSAFGFYCPILPSFNLCCCTILSFLDICCLFPRDLCCLAPSFVCVSNSALSWPVLSYPALFFICVAPSLPLLICVTSSCPFWVVLPILPSFDFCCAVCQFLTYVFLSAISWFVLANPDISWFALLILTHFDLCHPILPLRFIVPSSSLPAHHRLSLFLPVLSLHCLAAS